MARTTSQPMNPTDWQEWYKDLGEGKIAIPLHAADEVNNDSKIAIHRGIILDATTVLDSSMHDLTIYADVLAFAVNETHISPAKNGIVQILARVLTAAEPVTLVIPPGDAATSAISLYASVLDQPISVRTGDSKPITLELGPTTDNVGVIITFSGGEVIAEYTKRYSPDSHPQLRASLETGLRIALAGFWKCSSVCVSICADVAAITKNQKLYAMLNAQAVALGQQLTGRVMAGSDMSWAPVLPLGTYQKTVEAALAAMAAFEENYGRFQDKAESLQTQIEAGNTMLSQAIDNMGLHVSLRDSANAKYDYAVKSSASCDTQFRYENDALEIAEITFQRGIEKWKDEQKLQAIFAICKAIVTFAVGIGELCIGNPTAASGAAKAVDNAVEAVEDAEQIVNQVEAALSSETFKSLGKAAKALFKLYPSVAEIVRAVKAYESNPEIDLPTTGVISGSTEGDADSAAIATLAAWDIWILESDHQMEFAVSNEIEGASDYQLALRKHAINGKQLAQAQAEAIKAGYEYVQAQMEVIVCAKQVDELQVLLAGYTGQEDVYQQTGVQLYDRLLALRTGVVIELQNMIWAYRYWALTDSTIVLDATKSTDQYLTDLYTITREMETINEQYNSDFQEFTYTDKSQMMPLNLGPLLLEGLAGEKHVGSFTLTPDQDLAGQFFGGSHYRLNGLDPTLKGALPKSEFVADGIVVLHLEISTSGIYNDIQQGKVFHFSSAPQLRRCSYEVNEAGERGVTRDHPIFDSTDHAEPTPFTQWKIKVLNPEEFDLSGLTGVDLDWKGHVRFDPTRKLQ